MYMFHQIYPAYHDAHLRFISTSIDLVKDAHALGQLAVTINIYIILLSDFSPFFPTRTLSIQTFYSSISSHT